MRLDVRCWCLSVVGDLHAQLRCAISHGNIHVAFARLDAFLVKCCAYQMLVTVTVSTVSGMTIVMQQGKEQRQGQGQSQGQSMGKGRGQGHRQGKVKSRSRARARARARVKSGQG